MYLCIYIGISTAVLVLFLNTQVTAQLQKKVAKDKKNRSASVSQGHVVRCTVTVSGSGSPGLRVRLMRWIFHLYPPGLCVCVHLCVLIRGWMRACVCVCVCVPSVYLNSTEQVVRYHPNTVAWQMADRATCIPFKPPGQSPPHQLTDQATHTHTCTHAHTRL